MVGIAHLESQIKEIKSLLNELTNKDEFLNVDQFAEEYGISKSRIYKLSHKKEIPFHRAGERLLYFKRSDIENWIERGRVEPEAAPVEA